MATIHTYRYGSPRQEGEGLRIGVARQAPRGIKKDEWRSRGYLDARAIALAPSKELVSDYRHWRIGFEAFEQRYRQEMQAPAAQEMIGFLAAMALYEPISLGCFCEDESRCHRTILQKILEKEARDKAELFTSLRKEGGEPRRLTSPVCFADFSKE